MKTALVINGHLSGPRHIELDEPVEHLSGDVEIILRARIAKPTQAPSLSDVLSQMPAGTRSKEDMDGQIRRERQAWED
jgi:hypothetical protein